MTSDAEDADGVVPAPSTDKKKKKRKKRLGADAQPPAVVHRPKRTDFAEDWPAHPDLDALLAAFDGGNYAFVRERGRALLAEKGAVPIDARVRAAVEDLLRRIEPDRTAVIMLGVAMLLMAFLAWFYWTHPHGE